MKLRSVATLFGSWISLALSPSHAAVSSAGTEPRDVVRTASSSSAGSTREAPTVLSVFEVKEEKDEGYRSTQTVEGSNTLTNLRDTPNSISVMNRELIDDLISLDVRELSAYMVTGESTESLDGIFGGGHVFRGIASNIGLRDGVTWFTPVDTYNIERVEVLRGPTAFLYGEGTVGGLVNQLTKSAATTNHNRLNLIFGSNDLYRVEIDINRKLSDKLAVRGALAYQDGKSFQNHVGRTLKAMFLTTTYTPFANTRIKVSGELGRNHINLGSNVMADQFSTTERTGQTAAISATNGGYTYLPATGTFFRSTGVMRRSSGTGLAVFDENILPRALNFNGPDGQNLVHYGSLATTINQKVTEEFNVQFGGTFGKAQRTARQESGAAVDRIYLDTDRTLPDGTPNPDFNQYYTEFYNRIQRHSEPVRKLQVTAVYDLDLKFTKQRLVGMYMYQDDEPNMEFYSETVDPSSPEFRGTFNGDNTLAAFQANRTVHSQNFFYRRYYLKDGDGADITGKNIVPGRSVWMRDTVAESANGRSTTRKYKTPGYGFGASGTYFKGRLHSLVGWRRSTFKQARTLDFYNYVTNETYRVPEAVVDPVDLTADSYNYGGVFHVAKFLAASFNYSQSVALSSGIGGALLRPGTIRGPGKGDGNEYALRWSFLDGRLESNWTYYITNNLRVTASPAVPAVVRQNELGAIFDDINPSGGDLQTTKASGFEFETVANLTKNWRLTWNLATNELEVTERYPDVRHYQARAREQNIPTPETDAFLASVPEGTPLPGFTKTTSNLVTNYRFTSGPLKGFSIGGGGRYRDRSYRGNFVLDRDGTAEQLWSEAYTIWNLSLGYRTTILDRRTDIAVNISNVFDKDYFRSRSIGVGSWQEGRSFRCAIRTQF